MSVQADLLKTAGGVAAAASAIAGKLEDEPNAEKEASALALRKNKEPEEPKASMTEVDKVAEIKRKAEDSLKAAMLQREDKIFDDEARLRQRLREMKARELAKKKEVKE